jgi:antitoxin CcdA
LIVGSDARTAERATNVSINSELLHKAKALNINLSATLESALAALAALVKTRERELWKQKNVAAIEAYNRLVEKHGTFSDGVRPF